MTTPSVSPTTIKRHTNAQSFARGEEYYQSGAVTSLVQRGTQLQAEVEGSEVTPYRVTLNCDAGGITHAHCTCPYNFEGWCKHIAAVMLMCAYQPNAIESRPSLDELLNRLDLNQTRQAIRALLDEHPRLLDDFDWQVNLVMSAASNAPPGTPPSTAVPPKTRRRTTVDPAPFRRQVRQVLRGAIEYWENGYDDDPITDNLLEIVDKVREFSQAGDGENAIAILESITQTCADEWEEVADYGADSDEVVAELDLAWTEAILTEDLTDERKREVRSHLQAWEQDLDYPFTMSLTALVQGWNYPPLQRVLSGQITELGAWDSDAPDFADDLAEIRLSILERQERYQEYLYLAEAEGQTDRYLTMLAQQGRIDEAMTAAETQMTTQEDAFALAQTLRHQGAVAQALDIAQAGLSLPGHRLFDLAIWTSDLADGLGNPEVALAARVAAFKAKPSFQDYQRIEELAGTEWDAIRSDLLDNVRTRAGWGLEQAKVDIFLHEGLIDWAIATVSDLSFYHAALIHRVMDAAVSHDPGWVIQNARYRAEDIMDRGKSDAYHHAVEWLRKAQAAYQQSDRQADWSAYHQQLMHTHARKYKLMGMLKTL